LLEHFKQNKYFSDRQFGFLKGRSTVTQLLSMLDDWTELLESGGRIDVIYTDLEKAFDKVLYRRLISNLHSYQVNKEIILWIESFLIGRKQRVKIDEVMSEWSDVLSGIPQGSILGPVLFIIYINDLIESCGNDAKIYLFADDARLYNHIKCIVDAEILQSKNDKFTDWAHRWLVKLSTKKCKSMTFHQRHYDTTTNSFTYKIDGVPLEHVESYLGVLFNLFFVI